MQPLRLGIRNFCGHQETEFSFEDFQSALIIGKVKDNERFSNGAGKSTIFNAIEYVLFNEIHFSSLEKIIRDGCDVCKVEYDFISSLDKCVYRIVRANSRRTGTDVRLFKQTENNEWEDLTQRRVSDTEKEIVKIVGFNYKAFCASVLFSQAGSENNVQRDFGNLPALTPEKRKSVLREVLQLNVYGNYEKLAKSKYGIVQSSLEKQKIILSTIGDPDSVIKSLSDRSDELKEIIRSDTITLTAVRASLSQHNNEYTSLLKEVDERKNKNDKYLSLKNDILAEERSISNLQIERDKLLEEANNVSKEKIELEKIEIKDIEALAAHIVEYESQIIEIRSKIHSNKKLIKELESPISEDEICKHCHQNISQEHRQSWKANSSNQIQELHVKNQKLTKDDVALVTAKTQAKDEIFKYNNISKRIVALEADLQQKRNYYGKYVNLIEQHTALLKRKKAELEILTEELNSSKTDADAASEKLVTLVNRINELEDTESKFTKKMSALIGEQAVLKHKIESANLDKDKIVSIKTHIEELEKSLILHSKVVQAFGSNGIPALITHSILDELQEEANKWLLKLRPGLQLQFVVVNDKNNKEKEDTLDILYFIDGNQREYKQLSGAQKIIVSLAIKLALLFIMNKRIGVDIKLMLLDEVDQALDPGSTEVFADIIKIIQDEIKIMVITHDDDLKHKFSHAIMVEQDENNVSKGKLINW